jgi:hypothetical protein
MLARARVLVILQNTGLCLCFVKRIEKFINVSCGCLTDHCETNQLLCQPQIKYIIKDMPAPHRNPVTASHKRTGLVTFMHRGRCPFTIWGRLYHRFSTRTWRRRETPPGTDFLYSTQVDIRFNEQAVLSYVLIGERPRSSLNLLKPSGFFTYRQV